MENTGPIPSGQNVTPWLSMWSISKNILKVLANFLGIQNLNYLKNIGHDCGNTKQDDISKMKWYYKYVMIVSAIGI